MEYATPAPLKHSFRYIPSSGLTYLSSHYYGKYAMLKYLLI